MGNLLDDITALAADNIRDKHERLTSQRAMLPPDFADMSEAQLDVIVSVFRDKGAASERLGRLDNGDHIETPDGWLIAGDPGEFFVIDRPALAPSIPQPPATFKMKPHHQFMAAHRPFPFLITVV